jgi:hypothetical protein
MCARAPGLGTRQGKHTAHSFTAGKLERLLDVSRACPLHRNDTDIEAAGSLLDVLQASWMLRNAGVPQHGGSREAGQSLLEQIESLRFQLPGKDHGARDVASRSGEARD